MKIKLALTALAIVALSGCSMFRPTTGPKFPDTTTLLTTPCPDLTVAPDDTIKLSVLTDVVAANYTKYHQCANQVNGWIEWYNKEKQNYESVGKK